MRIITNINWIMLIMGILLLSYILLSKKSFGTDPAGQGLAEAFALFGLILLVGLLLANFLPFRWVRITIFVVLCLPMVGAVPQMIVNLINTYRGPQIEQGKYDGTYYFSDTPRRQIAQAIVAHDLTQLKTRLQSPLHNLNEPGADNITLLDFAAMSAVSHEGEPAYINCLSLLLEKGASFESTNPHHTPTHVLVCRGCTANLLEWFLKKGANPNANDPANEQAPMLFSTMTSFNGDRTEKIRFLIEHGADPNSLYPSEAHSWLAGHTALQAAARQEFWDVCQVLLEQGADPLRVGPQQFVFTKFVAHQEKLYAQLGQSQETFKSMQQTLVQVLARKNSSGN